MESNQEGRPMNLSKLRQVGRTWHKEPAVCVLLGISSFITAICCHPVVRSPYFVLWWIVTVAFIMVLIHLIFPQGPLPNRKFPHGSNIGPKPS
jgi:hypothetical protein